MHRHGGIHTLAHKHTHLHTGKHIHIHIHTHAERPQIQIDTYTQFLFFSSRGYLSKIKLNSQEWEAHTRTLPASQAGHGGWPHRLQVHIAEHTSNTETERRQVTARELLNTHPGP